MDTVLIYVILAAMIIIATTVFEFTKAAVSYTLGDRAVKERGELTLNPIKHFEPIGFLLYLFTGYGWGKPVQASLRNYKDKKVGTVLTYLIPMVVCVLIAEGFNAAHKLLSTNSLDAVFLIGSQIFMKQAIFNIIPVYPLSGSYILKAFLKLNTAMKYMSYEKIIQYVIVFLLLFNVLQAPLDFIVSALLLN